MFCVTDTETLFLDATILAKILRKWQEIISTQFSIVPRAWQQRYAFLAVS